MEKLLELILALVLIGAAFAFGSVQFVPIAFSLVEVILFFSLFFLVFQQTRQGKVSLRGTFWPLLFALLVFVETLPLPFRVVDRLSPARALSESLAGLVPGRRMWATISIYPHDTLQALVRFLAYFAAFLLAAYLFDSRKGKSNLVRALVFTGCFEAGYGIVQYLTSWQKIWTTPKRFYTAEATGTYVNRDHFAGLLELTLPFVVGLIFYYFQVWSSRRHAGFDRRASAERSSMGFRTLFYLCLLLIMIVGVIFSRSRMGILATLFTLIFLALLGLLKSRQKVWMVGVFLFLLCAVGYGLWIGLGPVLTRFEALREPNYLQMEGRISIWKDTMRLMRDYPLTGTGLGTFGVAYRRYQTEWINNYIDHAHNDYFEFASETGLPGAALLFMPILFLLVRMIVSFVRDSRRYRRSIALGCIGSTLAILLHSLVDFNLQIPANALVLAVVLGIGYKISYIEAKQESQELIRSESRVI